MEQLQKIRDNVPIELSQQFFQLQAQLVMIEQILFVHDLLVSKSEEIPSDMKDTIKRLLVQKRELHGQLVWQCCTVEQQLIHQLSFDQFPVSEPWQSVVRRKLILSNYEDVPDKYFLCRELRTRLPSKIEASTTYQIQTDHINGAYFLLSIYLHQLSPSLSNVYYIETTEFSLSGKKKWFDRWKATIVEKKRTKFDCHRSLAM